MQAAQNIEDSSLINMTKLNKNPAQAHFAFLLDTQGMIQLIGSNVTFLSQQVANTDLAGT